MFVINNEGANIKSTDYWGTEHAAEGLFFLTWYKRTARLLVPKSQELHVGDIKTGAYVIVTRGLLNGVDAIELLFEDRSHAPFSIHIPHDQNDHLPSESDVGEGYWLTVWAEGGIQCEMPAKIRMAQTLPDLSPW